MALRNTTRWLVCVVLMVITTMLTVEATQDIAANSLAGNLELQQVAISTNNNSVIIVRSAIAVAIPSVCRLSVTRVLTE